VEEVESKYKDTIEVVDIQYCDGDQEKAKEEVLSLLEKYPDINCFYGTNEGATMGIAQAIAQEHLEDQICVIGFDSSDEEIGYVKSGVIDGIVVQNPYNMGYLGVRYINKVLDGVSVDERIETGASFVCKDNLYDEDIQWLLYPLDQGN
jgi:ribose transport system substrate-binding protein